MMNIGCDVGKSKLDIFLGGKHGKFENNREGIGKFILLCRAKGEVRVVLEPTGGYERYLLRELFGSKISVSVVNPYYVRNFAKSKQDLAKTDKTDARVLSE
jgi:transposase